MRGDEDWQIVGVLTGWWATDRGLEHSEQRDPPHPEPGPARGRDGCASHPATRRGPVLALPGGPRRIGAFSCPQQGWADPPVGPDGRGGRRVLAEKPWDQAVKDRYP